MSRLVQISNTTPARIETGSSDFYHNPPVVNPPLQPGECTAQIMSQAYKKGIATLRSFLDNNNPDDKKARKQLQDFAKTAKDSFESMTDDSGVSNSRPYYFTEKTYQNLERIFELSQNRALMLETRRQIIIDLAEKLDPVSSNVIPDIGPTVDRLSALTSGLSLLFVEKTAAAIHTSAKKYMDSWPGLKNSVNKDHYQAILFNHVCTHFGLQKSEFSNDSNLPQFHFSEFAEYIKSSVSPEKIISETANLYHGTVINAFKNLFPILSARESFDNSTYEKFATHYGMSSREMDRLSFGEIVNERLIHETPEKSQNYQFTHDTTSLKARISHILHKDNPIALKNLEPKNLILELLGENGEKINIKQIGSDFTYACRTRENEAETYCSLDQLLGNKDQQSMDLLKQIMQRSNENSEARKISGDYLVKISIPIAKEMMQAATTAEARNFFEGNFYRKHLSAEKLATTEALEYALLNKKPEIARLLMTMMDSAPFDDRESIPGRSALIFALGKGELEIAEFLIGKMSADQISLRHENGCTALFLAQNGDKKKHLEKIILEKIWSGTPFLETVERVPRAALLSYYTENNEEHKKIREILIKNYYLPHINERSNRDGLGSTWLEYSMRAGFFESECMLFIGNMAQTQLEKTDDSKNTLLMRALHFNQKTNPDILNLTIDRMPPTLLGLVNRQGQSAIEIGLENKNTAESTLIMLYKKMHPEDIPDIMYFIRNINKKHTKLLDLVIARMDQKLFISENNAKGSVLHGFMQAITKISFFQETTKKEDNIEEEEFQEALMEKLITAAMDRGASIKNVDGHVKLLSSVKSQSFRLTENLLNELNQDQLGILDRYGNTVLAIMLQKNEISEASNRLMKLYQRHSDTYPENGDSELSAIINGDQDLLNKVNKSVKNTHRDFRLDHSSWSRLTMAVQAKNLQLIKQLISKMSLAQISTKDMHGLTALKTIRRQKEKIESALERTFYRSFKDFAPPDIATVTPLPNSRSDPYKHVLIKIPQMQTEFTSPPAQIGPQYNPFTSFPVAYGPQYIPQVTLPAQAGPHYIIRPMPLSFQEKPTQTPQNPRDLAYLLGLKYKTEVLHLNVEMAGPVDREEIVKILNQLNDIEKMILSKSPENNVP